MLRSGVSHENPFRISVSRCSTMDRDAESAQVSRVAANRTNHTRRNRPGEIRRKRSRQDEYVPVERVGGENRRVIEELEIDGAMERSGGCGVLIINANGEHLGTLLAPPRTSNATFGEDGSTLFITANTRLVRIRLNVKGVGF